MQTTVGDDAAPDTTTTDSSTTTTAPALPAGPNPSWGIALADFESQIAAL